MGIKIVAWFDLLLFAFLIIAEPYLIGKPRKNKSDNYDYTDWLGTLIGAGLFIPLCGRVLGWW